jgi:hypothetical protein
MVDNNLKVGDLVSPTIIYNTLLKKDKYEVRSIYGNKIEILSDYHGLKWYLIKNFKKWLIK